MGQAPSQKSSWSIGQLEEKRGSKRGQRINKEAVPKILKEKLGARKGGELFRIA